MTGRRRFGSIRKTSAGRYQARYQGPDRQARKGEGTFATKTDAARFLDQISTDMDRGLWSDPRSATVTLTDYAKGWLPNRPLAPRTRELYDELFRLHVLPTLGQMPLARITPPEVRKWHTETGNRTGQTRTSQAYRLLRAIMNTAVSDGLIRSNPCLIKGAGQTKTPERPLLSLADVMALVAAIRPEMQPVVVLTFWAHLRLGEVLALRREDVDLTAATLTIRRQLVRTKAGLLETEPKAASRRTVDLPVPALEAMRDHLARTVPALPSARLFTAPSGVELHRQHVGQAWIKARTEVGLPNARFHDLRHGGLTLVAQTGATLKEVMARGGHSTPRAAMIYQHNASERGRAIAATLSEYAAAAAGNPTHTSQS